MTQSKRSRELAEAKQFESPPLEHIVHPPTESNKKRRQKMLEAKKDMNMDFELESVPSLSTLSSPDDLKDSIRSLQLHISDFQNMLNLAKTELADLVVETMFDNV